jgi:hypothetical protein
MTPMETVPFRSVRITTLMEAIHVMSVRIKRFMEVVPFAMKAVCIMSVWIMMFNEAVPFLNVRIMMIEEAKGLVAESFGGLHGYHRISAPRRCLACEFLGLLQPRRFVLVREGPGLGRPSIELSCSCEVDVP